MSQHRDEDDSVDEAGSVMGRDPLADDDAVLARTLFGTGGPTRPQGSALPPTVRTTATPPRPVPAVVEAPPVAPRPESPARTSTGARRRSRDRKRQPDHYRILSISMYTEDIEKMDELVARLKEMGFTRASRSSLIRFALDQVDIKKMPRGY